MFIRYLQIRQDIRPLYRSGTNCFWWLFGWLCVLNRITNLRHSWQERWWFKEFLNLFLTSRCYSCIRGLQRVTHHVQFLSNIRTGRISIDVSCCHRRAWQSTRSSLFHHLTCVLFSQPWYASQLDQTPWRRIRIHLLRVKQNARITIIKNIIHITYPWLSPSISEFRVEISDSPPEICSTTSSSKLKVIVWLIHRHSDIHTFYAVIIILGCC